jgi:hypothetical protein
MRLTLSSRDGCGASAPQPRTTGCVPRGPKKLPPAPPTSGGPSRQTRQRGKEKGRALRRGLRSAFRLNAAYCWVPVVEVIDVSVIVEVIVVSVEVDVIVVSVEVIDVSVDIVIVVSVDIPVSVVVLIVSVAAVSVTLVSSLAQLTNIATAKSATRVTTNDFFIFKLLFLFMNLEFRGQD